MLLPASDRWFFLTGCQRSGTTLLRLILECHPSVFCFDEIDAYRTLKTRQTSEAVHAQRVGFKVPRWAEQLDRNRLTDYGEVSADRVYDGQPILFMVRDWRDAVCSMLQLKADKSWLEEWAEPIIQAKVATEPDFSARWKRELDLLAHASHRLVALGAFYWTYKSDALLRYAAAQRPVLAVSYEALVTKPEREIQRVCDILQIGYEPSMLRHAEFSHRELFSNGLTVGNTDPQRPIDQASVGRWHTMLSAEALTEGSRIVGDLPAQLIRPSDHEPTSVRAFGLPVTPR